MIPPNTVGALTSVVGGPKVASMPKMEANPIVGNEFAMTPYSMARKAMQPAAGIGGTTKKFDEFKLPQGVI